MALEFRRLIVYSQGIVAVLILLLWDIL